MLWCALVRSSLSRRLPLALSLQEEIVFLHLPLYPHTAPITVLISSVWSHSDGSR